MMGGSTLLVDKVLFVTTAYLAAYIGCRIAIVVYVYRDVY